MKASTFDQLQGVRGQNNISYGFKSEKRWGPLISRNGCPPCFLVVDESDLTLEFLLPSNLSLFNAVNGVFSFYYAGSGSWCSYDVLKLCEAKCDHEMKSMSCSFSCVLAQLVSQRKLEGIHCCAIMERTLYSLSVKTTCWNAVLHFCHPNVVLSVFRYTANSIFILQFQIKTKFLAQSHWKQPTCKPVISMKRRCFENIRFHCQQRFQGMNVSCKPSIWPVPWLTLQRQTALTFLPVA